MAKSVLICTTFKNVCTAPISSALDKKLVNKSTEQKSSSSRNRVTGISGVQGFQESLQIEGISSTGSRTHMVQHLSTEFMAKDKDRYIFYFSKFQKRMRKGRAPPAIIYFAFGKDKKLGVVETLN